MKRIKLKLNELTNPEILSGAQLKSLTGGLGDFCYTGMSCVADTGESGTCTSDMAGQDCYCTSAWGYGSSSWC